MASPSARGYEEYEEPVGIPHYRSFVETKARMGLVLLIVVVLLLLGAFPTWPHSRNWGYGPAGGLGAVLVVVLLLVVLGVVPRGF